jgi:hypothetical protein
VAPPLEIDHCDTLTGMPTDIHFIAENLKLRDAEEPSQVYEALSAAGGLPVRLSTFVEAQAVEVYVNPATIAFWRPGALDRIPLPPPPSHLS